MNWNVVSFKTIEGRKKKIHTITQIKRQRETNKENELNEELNRFYLNGIKKSFALRTEKAHQTATIFGYFSELLPKNELHFYSAICLD